MPITPKDEVLPSEFYDLGFHFYDNEQPSNDCIGSARACVKQLMRLREKYYPGFASNFSDMESALVYRLRLVGSLTWSQNPRIDKVPRFCIYSRYHTAIYRHRGERI